MFKLLCHPTYLEISRNVIKFHAKVMSKVSNILNVVNYKKQMKQCEEHCSTESKQ